MEETRAEGNGRHKAEGNGGHKSRVYLSDCSPVLMGRERKATFMKSMVKTMIVLPTLLRMVLVARCHNR